MDYFLTMAGLIALVAGGDYLVRGAVALARRSGMPTLLIGLTVVAFGTSAPELVVGVGAALKGFPTLALGNVVGSNIANVLLIIGVSALIRPLARRSASFRRDTWLMIAASVIFIGLCRTGEIVAWQGFVLLAILFGTLLHSARRSSRQPEPAHHEEEFEGVISLPETLRLSLLFLVVGLVGLALGSHFLVTGSVGIARNFGVSEAVIGLTLVAIGTSLPELATGTFAAMRGEGELAIGTVIGSNLFNILGVMGTTAMVRPIPIPDIFLRFDLWVMLAAALVLIPIAHRGLGIGRKTALAFLTLYVLYIMSVFDGASAFSLHH